jgi:hypothetical protein
MPYSCPDTSSDYYIKISLGFNIGAGGFMFYKLLLGDPI